MRVGLPILLGMLALGIPAALAQAGDLTVPRSIEAGAAFSIQCGGSGKGTLYLVGPGQAIKRDMQLGEAASFPAGTLYNAGHYLVWLTSEGSATQSGSLDVVPVSKPSDLTFIAKPSRLQVALHNGITGTAYVFDAYGNLITKPMQVSFELSTSAGTQTRTVETRDGAAWTEMDSSPREGKDHFVARVGDVSSSRVVGQVPGDPCSLKMNAKAAGQKIQLATDPVRDCSGNAVPDGTIVTFTELYNDTKSTVDVPIKKGIATVEMPAHRGATISVASGVVLGNQIRWEQ